jgi:uncharacterized alkaline shock family protein YloU
MTSVTPTTPAASKPGSALATPATTGGTTTIADGVVSKIAGIAARSVPGVHDLGGAAGRAIGAIRGKLNQTDHSQGISVEVGETQAAADVTLVAEYPMDLQQIADDVRTAVTDAIENYVGMEVTEVNVTVADVFIPSEDDSDDSDKRVQ